MAQAHNSTTYVEAATNATAELRDAATYVEAATVLELGEIRVTTSYTEVITPTRSSFIGWGMPISPSA